MEECSACAQRYIDWEVAGRLDLLLDAMLASDVESPPGISKPRVRRDARRRPPEAAIGRMALSRATVVETTTTSKALFAKTGDALG